MQPTWRHWRLATAPAPRRTQRAWCCARAALACTRSLSSCGSARTCAGPCQCSSRTHPSPTPNLSGRRASPSPTRTMSGPCLLSAGHVGPPSLSRCPEGQGHARSQGQVPIGAVCGDGRGRLLPNTGVFLLFPSRVCPAVSEQSREGLPGESAWEEALCSCCCLHTSARGSPRSGLSVCEYWGQAS